MTRISCEARQILDREFERDQNWSNTQVKSLAERLNLPRMKVYKWNWDQRNKIREDSYTSDSSSSVSYKQVGQWLKANLEYFESNDFIKKDYFSCITYSYINFWFYLKSTKHIHL